MSDPSHSHRRRPSRLTAGSVASSLFGVFLVLVPVALVGQAGTASPGDALALALQTVAAMAAVIVLNACFVAGETAIDLLRPGHLKQLATEEKRLAMVKDLLEGKALHVAACFLGSQTMRSWLVLFAVVPAWAVAPWLAQATGLAPGWPAVLVAAFAIGIPVVALNVVFGELVPRTYAVTNPVSAACRLYGFVKLFAAVFGLPSRAAMAIGGLLTQRFGARASFSTVNQAEEEIRGILDTAEEAGEIEEPEKEMLHSVFEFGDTVAREIMTPRVDLDAVPVGTAIADVARLVEATGHSRIPVYEGTDDQIVGIVHAKDVLRALVGGGETDLRRILRPAYFVPENKDLHDLLQEMRAARTQMVIVQDEFGGTAGVVTIEDIVEEVMGEIVDEYDVEEPVIVKNGHGFVVDGRVNLYDLNDEIGTEFESEEFDTIGGYVFGLFGRQPGKGEAIEDAGYRLEIVQTDGRRIQSIHLSRLEVEPSLLPDLKVGETA